MISYKAWNTVFETLVFSKVSPDEKNTFETSKLLAQKIIEITTPRKDEVVIDMGAGWGNLSLEIAPLVKQVIAIEPSLKNIKVAKERASESKYDNIRLINGKFENPRYYQKVDIVLSSLVLHQLSLNNKKTAIKETKKLLRRNGSLIICDTLMFFNPLTEPKKFNDIYRYLLPRTLPTNVYEKYVKPHFSSNKDYIYTWEDMKKYTSKEYWFYSFSELKDILESADFMIEDKIDISPFFGIIKARNN